jgi:hypothetical protein
VTGIDELIRETLTADAATHHTSGDLAERSMIAGRRLRLRRRAAMASVSLLSLGAVTLGSLVATGALSGSTQRIEAASDGGGNPPAPHGVPAWSTWPTDRVYGEKPGATFFQDLPGSASLLASGTLPDGMQFRFDYQPHSDLPIEDVAGFDDQPQWGDQPGAGNSLYRAHAPYFGYEFMTAATYDNGAEDGNTFWIVIAGQPGTTDAEYAEDGKTWEPMRIEHGIAVIKRHGANAGVPGTAMLHLEDSDGTYYEGPAALL